MTVADLYRVIVPLVILKTNAGDRYVYENGLFEDADLVDGEAARLLKEKFVEKFTLTDTPKAETEEVDPYKGKSAEDLKAELATRNEGRAEADRVVPAEPGNKAEVLAALKADDAKQSEK